MWKYIVKHGISLTQLMDDDIIIIAINILKKKNQENMRSKRKK